jgi:hypothetical protein
VKRPLGHALERRIVALDLEENRLALYGLYAVHTTL